MQGYLVLNGGEAFTSESRAMDRTWLRLVQGQHSPRVIVLPAAAVEKHQKIADQVAHYFSHLGVFAEYRMVVDPLSANTRTEYEVLDKVEAIVLTDGGPLDMVERLRGTQTEATLRRALWERTAAVMTTGASAMAAGNVFWFGDQWEPGLALVPHLAVVPHHDRVQMRLTPERLLADLPEGVTILGIDPTTMVICHPNDTYQVAGQGEVTVYRSVEQQDVYRAGNIFTLPSPEAE